MVIDPNVLLLFIPAALALNLTPGADMLFCLGQGLRSGRRAGIAASLGIATGAFLHTLMAALGLAVILQTYPIAFEAIRWAGVAYLIWLAIQAFRKPVVPLSPTAAPQGSATQAWRAGVVVCLLNPKVAVFTLAFLPQFVDPARGSTLLQFLILGVILTLGGTAINMVIAVFASRLGRALTTSRRAARILQTISALVFFGLAARLAFERR
ncbi:MAG: LysE family translocator [Pseudomonadota bacterium]